MLILAPLAVLVTFAFAYSFGGMLLRLIMAVAIDDALTHLTFNCIFALSILLFCLVFWHAGNCSGYLWGVSSLLFGGGRGDGVAHFRRNRAITTTVFQSALAALLLIILVLAPLLLLWFVVRRQLERLRTGAARGVSGGAHRRVRSRRSAALWGSLLVLAVLYVAWRWLGLASVLRLDLPAEVHYRNAPSPSGNGEDGNRGGGGSPAPLPPMPWGMALLCALVSRVATLGVVIMGLLSGYAAVASPYNFTVPFFVWRDKEESLLKIRDQLTRKQRYVLSLLANKKSQIAQEHYAALHTSTSAGDGLTVAEAQGEIAAARGGWLSRWNPLSAANLQRRQVGRRAGRVNLLRQECQGCSHLSMTLFFQSAKVESMLVEARRGSSHIGRCYAVVGIFFAVYALCKLALTIAGLVLFRLATEDPVSRAVGIFTSILSALHLQQSPLWIEVSSQVVVGLAFAVNTWMLALSIRGLLLIVFQVTLTFSSFVTPDSTCVGLAMVMGAYWIGQLVMLRQSLPSALPSSAGTEAAVGQPFNVLFVVLGRLPVYYYQRLHDWCFLCGLAFTVVAHRFVLNDALIRISGESA